MKLDIDKKAAIFRALAGGTLYDVGVEFGLDKHYKTTSGLRNKVYQIYRQVANDPEKYAIHPDTVNLVVDVVSSRKVATRPETTIAEKTEKIGETDIKSLTMGGRDSAAKLIRTKLAYLEANPKALNAESLVNLGKIFGILFDKSQIIQGQATEHVALMARVDPNMTPEEALAAIIRTREVIEADKHTD